MAGIFKSYDIRMTKGELDPITIGTVAKAVAQFYEKEGIKSVVVGRDMRLTSDEIYGALVKEFLQAGFEIHDAGMVSTPNLYFACRQKMKSAGVMVTGSHLDKNHNGLKLTRPGVRAISYDNGGKDVEAIYNSLLPVKPIDDVVEDYVQATIKTAGAGPDLLDDMKISIDGANSMAAQDLREVLKQYGSKVSYINMDIDGSFPEHDPKPIIDANLKQLANDVILTKANAGFTGDGDFDRIGMVDENGQRLAGDHIAALITTAIMPKNVDENNKPIIMYDLRSTRYLKKTIGELGGLPVMTCVGHSHIKNQMWDYLNKGNNVLFASELSNHMYFVDGGVPYENIALAVLYTLQAMKEDTGGADGARRTVSEMVEDMKKGYFHTGEINYGFDNDTLVKRALDFFRTQKTYTGTQSDLDGILIETPDFFLNVRESNTEPVVRFTGETHSENERQEMKAFVKDRMKQFGGRLEK